MWVVGINRPFYPSVSFWDNEQDALEEYKYLLRENEEGGIHDCKVFMAIVSCIDDIETNY